MSSLPFINDNGCGLAIATRTYFDAINKDGVQPTDKLKGQIKAQEDPYKWFLFVSNLSKNLDNAFKLWDAVSVVLPPVLYNCSHLPGLRWHSSSRQGNQGFEDILRYE